MVEVDSNSYTFKKYHSKYTSNTIGIITDTHGEYYHIAIDNLTLGYSIEDILYVVLPNIPNTPLAKALYE